MKYLGLFLMAAASAAWGENVYFDVHVPGYSDAVYVNDTAMNGQGNLRNMVSNVSGAGDYEYTIRVVHDGVSVARKVPFKGTEGKINVYFQAEEFEAGKIAALPGQYVNSYHSPDPNRIYTAKAGLRSALGALDPMIARSASAQYWRDAFFWPELTRSATDGEATDADRLTDIYRRLFRKEPGMEYDQVIAVQEAVRELRDATYFANLKDGETEYRRVLGELSKAIAKYEAEQKSADRIALGKLIHWLERGRLATTLVQSLHGRYVRANNLSQFNISMIQKYAMQPVNQTQSGSYNILGNPTSSVSTVQGQTYLRFIPSESHAEIEVGMTGMMYANSVSTGGERGVTVQVNGHTQNYVQVSKRISVHGLSQDKVVAHPAQANVQTVAQSSQVHSHANAIMPRLPPRLQFIRNTKQRIGYETALERMPAGQAEGRRIAAGELAQKANQPVQMPEQMKNVAEQFQGLVKEFIELAQKRAGVFPRNQWLSSDSSWIYMKHIRRTEEELTSFTPPPAFRIADHEIGVRVHESEVTNTANRQLSGTPLTDADVQWFGRNILNYVPAPLRLGSHAARWTAHLAWDHPFEVDLGTERIDLVAHFQRVEIEAHRGQPARTLSGPFKVSVSYRATKDKDGPMLARLSAAKLEGGDPALQAFFAPKMDALFKEELHFDGFTPVRGGIFEPLTKLLLNEFRTENNWLLVGAKLDGDLMEIIKITPSGLGGDEGKVIPADK